MTDIHDLRAQMREGRGARPVVVHGGGFKLPFGLLAGAAVIAASCRAVHAEDLFGAAHRRLAGVQGGAAGGSAGRGRAGAAAGCGAAGGPKSDYAGKGADEAGRIADAVCEQRLNAAPQRGQAAVEAKLHCFLSEGTARFCTGGQARKATADIINYFKGIEYTNTAMAVAAKMPGPFRSPSVDTNQPPTPLTPDPRVAEAIEGLMRADT